MLLDVTACYDATFRRKPARNIAAGYLKGVFTVAVAELSEKDVRTAVRFGYRSDPYKNRWDLQGPRREVRGVEYAGRLYFPMEPEGSAQADLAWLTSCCERADGPFRNGKTFLVDQLADTDDRLVVASSGREEMAALLAERASRTILIDGRVWQAGNEPFLEVSVTLGDDERFFVKGEVRFDEKGADVSSSYRLDQRDLAVALLRGAFNEEVGLDMPTIEVSEASVLHARFDERHLADASVNLLIALRKDALDRPVAHLVTFAKLRDRLTEFREALASDAATDVDALVDALEEAAALDFDDHTGAARRALGAVRRVGMARGDYALVYSMAF